MKTTNKKDLAHKIAMKYILRARKKLKQLIRRKK